MVWLVGRLEEQGLFCAHVTTFFITRYACHHCPLKCMVLCIADGSQLDWKRDRLTLLWLSKYKILSFVLFDVVQETRVDSLDRRRREKVTYIQGNFFAFSILFFGAEPNSISYIDSSLALFTKMSERSSRLSEAFSCMYILYTTHQSQRTGRPKIRMAKKRKVASQTANPVRKFEKQSRIRGLSRTTMDMTVPTRPSEEMMVKVIPSRANRTRSC